MKDGTVQVADRSPESGTPNGLALSPDEKYLYACAAQKIARYEVRPDGTLANRSVFFDMSKGYCDGIKVDVNGNVYSTGAGVSIVSPQGRLLGRLNVPTTNFTFGGPDGKMLYSLNRGTLRRLPMKVAGARP